MKKLKQAEQEQNSMFMEGYRIGLAEMREKCAKVVTEHAPTCSPHWVSYVVAIRSIKFEGDTGFRPVSEMVAEQEPAAFYAAPVEPVKQEPYYFGLTHDHTWLSIDKKQYDKLKPEGRMVCYAAPVRTKDLTDEEIAQAFGPMRSCGIEGYLTTTRERIILRVRAVILADREKNK